MCESMQQASSDGTQKRLRCEVKRISHGTPLETIKKKTRSEGRDVYIAAPARQVRLVGFSCKMPLPLREKLEEVARDYRTPMTSVVIDLLQLHLPKIPPRPAAGQESDHAEQRLS